MFNDPLIRERIHRSYRIVYRVDEQAQEGLSPGSGMPLVALRSSERVASRPRPNISLARPDRPAVEYE